MSASNVVYKLNAYSNMYFNQLSRVMTESANDGYNNLGNWIEPAAKLAGP